MSGAAVRIAAAGLATLLCAQVAHAESFRGTVVKVTDGDTVRVLVDTVKGPRQRKVRLYGIDAPEKQQPFGKRAKKGLSELVAGKDVRVEVVDVDRYGRLVAQLYVDAGNGANGKRAPIDAGLELLKRGLAWHYKKYSDDESYAISEERARLHQRGLWKEPGREAPWEFRDRQRRERRARKDRRR